MFSWIKRHVHQSYWIEEPLPQIHTSMHTWFFIKKPETHYGKKENTFNKWCWSNWTSASRRVQIDSYLVPCIKLKSKWMKDLNIKQDTLIPKIEKLGNDPKCIGTRHKFLDRTPEAQSLKWTIINRISWSQIASIGPMTHKW